MKTIFEIKWEDSVGRKGVESIEEDLMIELCPRNDVFEFGKEEWVIKQIRQVFKYCVEDTPYVNYPLLKQEACESRL